MGGGLHECVPRLVGLCLLLFQDFCVLMALCWSLNRSFLTAYVGIDLFPALLVSVVANSSDVFVD